MKVVYLSFLENSMLLIPLNFLNVPGNFSINIFESAGCRFNLKECREEDYLMYATGSSLHISEMTRLFTLSVPTVRNRCFDNLIGDGEKPLLLKGLEVCVKRFRNLRGGCECTEEEEDLF